MFQSLGVSELNSTIDVLAGNTEVYQIVHKYPVSAINNFTETTNFIAINSSKLGKIPDVLITQGFLKRLDQFKTSHISISECVYSFLLKYKCIESCSRCK